MSQSQSGVESSSTKVERKKLNEAIVSVAIPRRVMPSDANSCDCAHFAYSVKGGIVRACLRGSDAAQYRGKTIAARAELYQEKRPDGSCDLCIDLHPVERMPTRRLCVIGSNTVPKRYRFGTRKFEVPEPKSGLVIFASIVG